MFTNIEKKIKIMALVVPAVILLSSLIMTIMIWVGGSRIIGVTGLGYSSYGSDAGGSVFLIGFLVLLFGALTAVLTCFLLYGFGELIEQTRWQAQSMGNLTGTPMPEPFVLQPVEPSQLPPGHLRGPRIEHLHDLPGAGEPEVEPQERVVVRQQADQGLLRVEAEPERAQVIRYGFPAPPKVP